MAVRFDSTSDRVLHSNPDVDGDDLYTAAAWFYRVGTPSAYGTLYTLNTNDTAGNTNIDAVLIDSSNRLQSYVGDSIDSGFSSPGTTLSANTWYYIAWVNSSLGVNGFKVYVNGVLDTENAYDRTGRTAAFTREEMGAIYSINQYLFNGRVSNFMFWRRVLTANEIIRQMGQFEPIYPNDLRVWSPFRDRGTARLMEYSRGNNWTAAGTLTDEADPTLFNYVSNRRYFFGLPLYIPDTSSPVSITLDTASVSASGQPLTIVPGAVSVSLATALAQALGQAASIVSTVSIPLDTASVSASGQSLTVVPGAAAVALSSAVVSAIGRALSVVPGARTITLSTSLLTASGQTLSVHVGYTVALDTAVISVNGQSMTVVPGAVSTALDTASLTASGVSLLVVPGAVSTALQTASLLADGTALSVVPGAALVVLDTASVQADGQTIAVVPGGVTILLDTAALIAGGQAVDVSALGELIATVRAWTLDDRALNWTLDDRDLDWSVDDR